MKKRCIKTKPKLKKKLWNIFSKYIRLRDAIKTTGSAYQVRCITCNTIKGVKEVDAGHFISRTANATFFDEHNVHAQCVYCNKYRNGEQYLYSLKIKELYGEGELNRIVSLRYQIKSFKIFELEEMIKLYNMKLIALKKAYGDPWKTI